ncbi:MAG: hypothetical protein K2Q34_06910 [Alphaproteobacteria bacterium]|nr:hypothetical protein [Alphaproteobacteria bacterium]
MMNFSSDQNLRNELLVVKQEKQQIEQEMSSLRKLSVGAIDMQLYRMKKQKSALQEKITKINSVLRPDIIA